MEFLQLLCNSKCFLILGCHEKENKQKNKMGQNSSGLKYIPWDCFDDLYD
ncbi:hypothetical protein [Parafilimonas terrae]|nr:hypothetical protein [Parafilimonas terrae]